MLRNTSLSLNLSPTDTRWLPATLETLWEQSMQTLRSELAQAAVALPPLLTRQQAAAFAHVTTRTISRWLEEGRLKASKTHPDAGRGRTLILKSSLLALLGGEQ
ncbi:MAG: helix-turn-helix domain-containing protein [Planctomycetes bacterium]|nr:helix-turn-helix domain-containing protein [Planctomycetota bacterium]